MLFSEIAGRRAGFGCGQRRRIARAPWSGAAGQFRAALRNRVGVTIVFPTPGRSADMSSRRRRNPHSRGGGRGRPEDWAKWLRETLPLTGEGTGCTRPEQIVLPGTASLPWLSVLQVRGGGSCAALPPTPLLRACRCREPGIGPPRRLVVG